MHQEPLLPNVYYHLFNHAVGNECLFRQHDNYLFFLQRYAHYIYPVARTYAYCLMPNHFHVLVQIRGEDELDHAYRQLYQLPNEKSGPPDYPAFVMQQFSNLFNSYAKAYNRRFERKGALFLDYLRRKSVGVDAYFTTLVAYIHQNAVHHGFCRRVEDWPYSSLHSLCSSKPTRLERHEMLNWFGGLEQIVAFHQQNQKSPMESDWEFGHQSKNL